LEALAFLSPFNRIEMDAGFNRFHNLSRRRMFEFLLNLILPHKLLNHLPRMLFRRCNRFACWLTVSTGNRCACFLITTGRIFVLIAISNMTGYQFTFSITPTVTCVAHLTRSCKKFSIAIAIVCTRSEILLGAWWQWMMSVAIGRKYR